MSYKVKHIVNKYPVILKKKKKKKAENMTQKRDLTSEKKIVNNLGLPVFFMIIFHNCTTNKWYS